MKPNLPQHPCAGKCQRFTDEQCKTCLDQKIEDREFQLGVAPDEAYVKTLVQEYLPGDVVCITEAWRPNTNNLYVFENVSGDTAQVSLFASGISRTMAIAAGFCVSIKNIRHATAAEIHANRRLTPVEQALAEVS
ncbi:hypothetical protein KW868_13700 [Acinetobacter guillouiae]|uniref:Uncharacterized protein n=1 Tax=Acinetobacter guillouiae TaxID=106649 RepID=A0A8X8GL96_ACIGI|nr:hypothetical protein [Acinetobacter guillouiae]MCF0265504.1 hypothetical protein [Acinetobacter guillouiae]